MSIYITGDCHGDYRRFSTEIFPEQYTMGKSDYVIVCGDFGYWSEDREQLWWRKWLDKRSHYEKSVDYGKDSETHSQSCFDRRSVEGCDSLPVQSRSVEGTTQDHIDGRPRF